VIYIYDISRLKVNICATNVAFRTTCVLHNQTVAAVPKDVLHNNLEQPAALSSRTTRLSVTSVSTHVTAYVIYVIYVFDTVSLINLQYSFWSATKLSLDYAPCQFKVHSSI